MIFHYGVELAIMITVDGRGPFENALLEFVNPTGINDILKGAYKVEEGDIDPPG